MVSLITATSGLLSLVAVNSVSPRVPTVTSAINVISSTSTNFQVEDSHPLLYAYEPPPDIGGPKRTGGSGGRYFYRNG
jgi:hypothetical protein